MPHFDADGNDTWICQICGHIFPAILTSMPHSRKDITECACAGNVCHACVTLHDDTGLKGEALREFVRNRRNRQAEPNRPISLAEHCRRESGGLTGQRLWVYMNRHYGHG